ncbi:MAG: DUF192 domain-containing protein [Spirochaetota bacterium]
MKLNFILVILLTDLILCVSCIKGESERITLSINGRPLIVEVARNDTQREKGLMFRDKLGWNEGMLFIFDDDEYLSFWMKDTSIPLSIAFLDKNGKVTDIFDMEPYSLVPVRSSVPCRYAIEVKRNYFTRCNLKIGDTVDLKKAGIK